MNASITRQSGGGAKIPGILVTQPKGVAKIRGEDRENQDSGAKQDLEQVLELPGWQKGGKRGAKRLKYLGDDSNFNMFSEDEGGTRDIQDVELEAPKLEKRRRSRSPDLGCSPKPPTQDPKSPGEKLKTTPPLRNFTDILMRRKVPGPNKNEEQEEETKTRTPVRVRVKRLERGKEVQTPGKGGAPK